MQVQHSPARSKAERDVDAGRTLEFGHIIKSAVNLCRRAIYGDSIQTHLRNSCTLPCSRSPRTLVGIVSRKVVKVMLTSAADTKPGLLSTERACFSPDMTILDQIPCEPSYKSSPSTPGGTQDVQQITLRMQRVSIKEIIKPKPRAQDLNEPARPKSWNLGIRVSFVGLGTSKNSRP